MYLLYINIIVKLKGGCVFKIFLNFLYVWKYNKKERKNFKFFVCCINKVLNVSVFVCGFNLY